MFHEKVVRDLEELEDEMSGGDDSNVLDFVKIGEPGIDDDYGLDDLPALLYFAQVDPTRGRQSCTERGSKIPTEYRVFFQLKDLGLVDLDTKCSAILSFSVGHFLLQFRLPMLNQAD